MSSSLTNFDVETIFDVKMEMCNHGYMKDSKENTKFYYMEKQIYKSRIVIYTNIRFEGDVIYQNLIIPEEIIFPKLISFPSERIYLILSYDMTPMYMSYIENDSSYLYLDFDKIMGILDNYNDMKDVYNDIRQDYCRKIIDGLSCYLGTYLLNDVKRIVFDYLKVERIDM